MSVQREGDDEVTGQNNQPVDCERALQQMQEFLDTELETADMDAIREHLTACEPCLENFDAEQALKQLVHRCCGTSEVQAPAALRIKISQRAVFLRD
ncbi:mycothiol system anti-sigma-R factor [Naumannella halotolerans]|uniref:Mycothiol system anti-sigma-R factor n=1 Tax=Naumannella halotolerans TaxID=993414 RepID=A0A4V3ENG2_9ACTN|nr:mycothiol system anti-sigma-R factor [Naumannella halotolerans]TDT33668.1 mycothiol system anti-sigma-R factor [Naumannella halotolerans]